VQVGGRSQSLCRYTGAETWRVEISESLSLDPEGSRYNMQIFGLWLCCFNKKQKCRLRQICMEDQILLSSFWICTEGLCIIIFLFLHSGAHLL
ncbi:Hypothetical predicted protein, partial [Scomber scombrus]